MLPRRQREHLQELSDTMGLTRPGTSAGVGSDGFQRPDSQFPGSAHPESSLP